MGNKNEIKDTKELKKNRKYKNIKVIGTIIFMCIILIIIIGIQVGKNIKETEAIVIQLEEQKEKLEQYDETDVVTTYQKYFDKKDAIEEDINNFLNTAKTSSLPVKSYEEKLEAVNKDIASLTEEVERKIKKDYKQVSTYELKIYDLIAKAIKQPTSCTAALISTSLDTEEGKNIKGKYKESKKIKGYKMQYNVLLEVDNKLNINEDTTLKDLKKSVKEDFKIEKETVLDYNINGETYSIGYVFNPKNICIKSPTNNIVASYIPARYKGSDHNGSYGKTSYEGELGRYYKFDLLKFFINENGNYELLYTIVSDAERSYVLKTLEISPTGEIIDTVDTNFWIKAGTGYYGTCKLIEVNNTMYIISVNGLITSNEYDVSIYMLDDELNVIKDITVGASDIDNKNKLEAVGIYYRTNPTTIDIYIGSDFYTDSIIYKHYNIDYDLNLVLEEEISEEQFNQIQENTEPPKEYVGIEPISE